jgi:hypothetical protein
MLSIQQLQCRMYIASGRKPKGEISHVISRTIAATTSGGRNLCLQKRVSNCVEPLSSDTLFEQGAIKYGAKLT